MTARTHVDPAGTRRAHIWGAVYFVHMALTIYWAMTTTGPGLWLARAQAALFGGLHSIKLTVLLLNLPALVLLISMSSRRSAAPVGPAAGAKH